MVWATNLEVAFVMTRLGVRLSTVDPVVGSDGAGAEIFHVEPSDAASVVEPVVELGETGVFVSPPHAIAPAISAARPKKNHFFCMHLLQIDVSGPWDEPSHLNG